MNIGCVYILPLVIGIIKAEHWAADSICSKSCILFTGQFFGIKTRIAIKPSPRRQFLVYTIEHQGSCSKAFFNFFAVIILKIQKPRFNFLLVLKCSYLMAVKKKPSFP